MRRKTDATSDGRIGRCVGTEGQVLISKPGGQENSLLPGVYLGSGDRIRTSADAIAALRFDDGTFVALGVETLIDIEYYSYERDASDDGARFSLEHGYLVIEPGDLAVRPDDFVAVCGGGELSLRSAWIACRADPLENDLVTLLPSRSGPQGEVLAQNKIGMQMLSRPWQTIRLAGDDADIPSPLTLPSGVVLESFRSSGIAAAIEAAVGVDRSAGELSEDFQRFDALQDRFLERQFVSRQIFPNDGPVETGDGDGMLEDAFEGTRFRLAGTDPEPSA